MTESHRRKLVRDAAEEVCWAISNAANLGIPILEYIKSDFDKWGDLVDWKNYK